MPRRQRRARRSRSNIHPFQDTVIAVLNLEGDDQSKTFVIPISNLIPSLLGRAVCVHFVTVQFPAILFDDEANFATLAWSAPGTGITTPSGTFRSLSATNPTTMCLDINKMSRYAPALKFIAKSNDDNNVPLTIRMRLEKPGTGIGPYAVRITTHCSVFPQESIETVAFKSIPSS